MSTELGDSLTGCGETRSGLRGSGWTAVADCDLVIESIIEDLQMKKALFQRLEHVCSADAILTTNTSTLSVTAMMAVCRHRDRVAGLHFFNPAPVMKLVEIIHAFETSETTLQELSAFCSALGKDPVIVQDTTGFIVNRLLTPYMLNAIRMLERGTGTIESIDHAMKAGAAHPIGPFELADYIGLDVVEAMAHNIFEDVRHEHHAPPHTLTRLVQLGYLGKKTNKGVAVRRWLTRYIRSPHPGAVSGCRPRRGRVTLPGAASS